MIGSAHGALLRRQGDAHGDRCRRTYPNVRHLHPLVLHAFCRSRVTRWTCGASSSGGGNWGIHSSKPEKSSGSVAAPFSIGKARSGRYRLPLSLLVRNCCVCGNGGRSLGPVTLLYADYAGDPMSLEASASDGSILVRSERHPDNENALKSAARLRGTMTLFIAFIMDGDGNVI